MKYKIYLDTNFLLIPLQFNIDIFEQIKSLCSFPYQLYVLNTTIKELKKIIQSKQKQKDKRSAKVALQLIEKENVEIEESVSDNVDNALVQLSQKENTIIATQDIELKRKLQKPYIILRQKKYLQLIK